MLRFRDDGMIERIKSLVLERFVLLSSIVLVALYVVRYLSYGDLPGNRIDYPLGWWGWFDQSKTLESAKAFAQGDYSVASHWYPLGYSLLGSLFERRMPMHAFFIINIVSFLAVYFAFISVCRRLRIQVGWAVFLFFSTQVIEKHFFDQWIIPWNTTPTAALIWLLIANVLAYLEGNCRPILIGLLAGMIPTLRPVELIVVAPCLLIVLSAALSHKKGTRFLDIVWVGVAAIIPVGFYLLLHIHIYGAQPSQYMKQSHDMGFSFYNFLWKAYVVFVEPREWFEEGEGLLHYAPWIFLGLAGLIPSLLQGAARAFLAVIVMCHAIIYLGYIDFLPSGLWRYNLVHYWVWIFPAYGLLGFLLLQDSIKAGSSTKKRIAHASILVWLLILCIKIVPTPAKDNSSTVVDFYGVTPTFSASYFDRWQIRDDVGVLSNIYDVRGQPISAGLRVFSIQRPFIGKTMEWTKDSPFSDKKVVVPSRFWDFSYEFGLPCWGPWVRCSFHPSKTNPI